MSLLDKKISTKNLSQAYIFESQNSDYNLDFAKDFAKSVFEDKGIQIENDKNPDLYIIDTGNEIIDIETVRLMLKDIALKPANNIIKIYIIHNAQKLRAEGANAMLKTIEELKSYNMVIFTTTNSNILLPTIRSRCQLVQISNNKSNYDIDLIELSNIISEVYKGNIGYYYQQKGFFTKAKDNKEDLIDAFIDVFRLVISGESMTDSVEKEVLYNTRKLENISLDTLEDIVRLIYKIKQGFNNNINYDLAIEQIIFRIYEGGMLQ